MERRDFIRKSVLTAGALSLPYILPSGRLFAKTGDRKVNHVVFCLFAGGVRNLEAMHKADGNLMPNILSGTEAISSDIAGSMSALPQPFSVPLQNYGTLFREFRFKRGATGHFNGHTTAITGLYNENDVNIRTRPAFPTIFEYYRKHNSPSKTALNSWWVSNALGPYPALNYSNYAGYGATYGANFIQPLSLIYSGFNVLSDAVVFPEKETVLTDKFRNFCDDNFSQQFQAGDAGVTNIPSDAEKINAFIGEIMTEASSGVYNNPWNSPSGMNNDMQNIFFTEKIIEEFQPELLVVNMQDVDVAHNNFTAYADNLRRADYALGHLWNFIQNTPGMADDTILIAMPEHGRNIEPNTLVDANGRFALDHTNDASSREIFCLVLGPSNVIKQNQLFTEERGESIDVVPTIANILGFDSEMPGLTQGRVLNEIYV